MSAINVLSLSQITKASLAILDSELRGVDIREIGTDDTDPRVKTFDVPLQLDGDMFVKQIHELSRDILAPALTQIVAQAKRGGPVQFFKFKEDRMGTGCVQHAYRGICVMACPGLDGEISLFVRMNPNRTPEWDAVQMVGDS